MAKILIADDNPDILELIQEALSMHELIIANNGEEAVAKALSEKPELIVMDVKMPVLNGLKACRQIKDNPKTLHIPILMLTGMGKMSDVEGAFEAQADDYIVKPFTPRILEARIADLLKKQQKE